MVHFWHRHREGAWNKLATATLSWLSFVPDMLSHLTLLSWSLGNRWKEALGFWLGLLSQLVTYVQVYRVVLDRTSTDSHSSHTVVNVQVSCLSLWSLKLGSRYSCSHARVSKCPSADFAIHYNSLRAVKEQPDVTSYIPCVLSLACNWSIVLTLYCNFGIAVCLIKIIIIFIDGILPSPREYIHVHTHTLALQTFDCIAAVLVFRASGLDCSGDEQANSITTDINSRQLDICGMTPNGSNLYTEMWNNIWG